MAKAEAKMSARPGPYASAASCCCCLLGREPWASAVTAAAQLRLGKGSHETTSQERSPKVKPTRVTGSKWCRFLGDNLGTCTDMWSGTLRSCPQVQ